MRPHLIKGRKLPRDLEEYGKGIVAWVILSVEISCLEDLEKNLEARARKSSVRSGKTHLSALHQATAICLLFVQMVSYASACFRPAEQGKVAFCFC